MFAFVKRTDLASTTTTHVTLYNNSSKDKHVYPKTLFGPKNHYCYIRGLDCYIRQHRRYIASDPQYCNSTLITQSNACATLQNVVRSFSYPRNIIREKMGCELLLQKSMDKKLCVMYIKNTGGNVVFNTMNSLRCYFTLYTNFDILILMFLQRRGTEKLNDFNFVKIFFDDDDDDVLCHCQNLVLGLCLTCYLQTYKRDITNLKFKPALNRVEEDLLRRKGFVEKPHNLHHLMETINKLDHPLDIFHSLNTMGKFLLLDLLNCEVITGEDTNGVVSYTGNFWSYTAVEGHKSFQIYKIDWPTTKILPYTIRNMARVPLTGTDELGPLCYVRLFLRNTHNPCILFQEVFKFRKKHNSAVGFDVTDFNNDICAYGLYGNRVINHISGCENANVCLGTEVYLLNNNETPCFVIDDGEEKGPILDDMEVAFIDIETTGLNAGHHSIYCVGVCYRRVSGTSSLTDIDILTIPPSKFRDMITPELIVERILSSKSALYTKITAENIHIYICQNEAELLYKLEKTLLDRPNLIYLSGYNLPFDISFIFVRMLMHNCKGEIFSLHRLTPRQRETLKCGYLAYQMDEVSRKASFRSKQYDPLLKLINSLIHIKFMCLVDLLKLFKIKCPSLSNYKLNSAAKILLEVDQKMDISVGDLLNYFQLTNREKILDIITYCLHDSALCSLIEQKLSVFMELDHHSCMTGKNIETIYSWIQTPSKIIDRSIKRYSDQNNLKHVTCFDSLEWHNSNCHRIKGGLVMFPLQSTYCDHYLATADFRSLYPSIMQTYNICASTLVFHSGIVTAMDRLLIPSSSFERYSELCLSLMGDYVPFDLIDDTWDMKAYSPRNTFDGSLERIAYHRMDIQVEPGGITHLFPYYATIGKAALFPFEPQTPYEIQEILLGILHERGLEEEVNSPGCITEAFLSNLLIRSSNCSKTQRFVHEMTARLWDTGAYTRIWIARTKIRCGILSNFQRTMGERRGAIRNQMAGANELERRRLDVQQNQIKIIMNSTYGLMALNNKPLASLITQIGRRTIANIQIAGQIIDKNYITTYGDTDSCFFYMNVQRSMTPDKAYLDIDLLLEIESQQKFIDQISCVLKGLKQSSFNMPGINVMKLVPEKIILLATIWGKKSYVLLYWRNESTPYRDLIKTLADGGTITSNIFKIIPRLESSLLKGASTHILRINIWGIVNFYLNRSLKTTTTTMEDYASLMVGGTQACTPLDDVVKDAGQYLDMYYKGIFVKGDSNYLELAINYITQINKYFPHYKLGHVLAKLIKNIVTFNNSFTDMSYWKSVRKATPNSPYDIALKDYNKDPVLFPELKLGIKSLFGNMVYVNNLYELRSNDWGAKWFTTIHQERKSWNTQTMCGILSGNSILQKSVVVNVFKIVVDAIQKLYLGLHNQFKMKLSFSYNRDSMNGICFQSEEGSTTMLDKYDDIVTIMDHFNCCKDLAIEIQNASSHQVLFMNLMEITKSRSAFMSCSNEKCQKIHTYFLEKLRINCGHDKKVFITNPEIKLIVLPLLRYKLDINDLIDKCIDTIFKHIRYCKLSINTYQNYIDILWGVTSCKDICLYTLDTHMYIVLIYFVVKFKGSTFISPDGELCNQLKQFKYYSKERNAFVYGHKKTHHQSKQMKIDTYFQKMQNIGKVKVDTQTYDDGPGIYNFNIVFFITNLILTHFTLPTL